MKTLKTTGNGKISGNGNGRLKGNGNGHTQPVLSTPTAKIKNGPSAGQAVEDLVARQLEEKPAPPAVPSISVRVERAPEKLVIQVQTNRPQLEAKPVSPWLNPTQFERPAFLMNFPFSYATGFANNPWMEDMKGDKRQPDFLRAAVQFFAVYQNISAEGLVYVLPTPRATDLQDLMYTANLGIILDHLPDKNTVVISNFTSAPRSGETAVGVK